VAEFNMKTIASLLLVCWCVNSQAQTNSAPAEQKPDSSRRSQAETPSAKVTSPAPPAQTNQWRGLTLATPSPDPEDRWLREASVSGPSESSDPLALSSTERVMLRYYQRVDDGGHLTPPAPPSDDLYLRGMDAIFKPEPVRVGKTSVAFTPITAIKRKNPLALLNPLVLSVSW
jgi:hypothetical protein